MLNIDTRLLETLSNDAFITICHIAKRIGKNKSCWPSISLLKKETGFGRHRLDNAIKELVESGHVGKEQRQSEKGTFQSNQYVLKTKLIAIYAGQSVVLSSDVGSSGNGSSDVGSQDNKVLEKTEVLKKKEVLGRKEKGIAAYLADFEKIEIVNKTLLRAIKEKDRLALIEGLSTDFPTIANEIATAFVIDGRTLDPKKPKSIKGLVGWAKGYIERLPKETPGESGPLTMIDRVEEVCELFQKHFHRPPSDRAKAAAKFRIRELMKQGETLEGFDKTFAWARESGAPKWFDFETSINGYERLKNYAYDSVA